VITTDKDEAMKKRQKEKTRKADMPEFIFKEFTPEEDKIYEEAVNKYREAVAAGKTLRQAYEGHLVADKELETVIQADFLKIMIADLHFGKGTSLAEVARLLSVPNELVRDTKNRMLQEAGVTAGNQFAEQFGDVIPKRND
jgi:hypothetical protein